jgi:translation initiation factor 2B subunit (eIF-2B alpha/beta/delta family)
VESLLERARLVAADRDGGASALLARLLPILSEALTLDRATLVAVARTVCFGQPSMAPLWNACAAALADWRTEGRFARIRMELERSPRALQRAAALALTDALAGETCPRVITLSYSGSAIGALRAVAAGRPIATICGEGRPRYEGRRAAATLAAAGARAVLTTDAALSSYLESASAVVVGADAIATARWINKVGTLGVCTAADRLGVPVFVVAGREKAWAEVFDARWRPASGDPDDVWQADPAAFAIENRLFEAVPAELATLFLTDAGAVAPSDLSAISERFAEESAELIKILD